MRRIQAGFVLIIVGMAVALLPFCHTEKTIGDSQGCPACHFLQITAAVLFLVLVLLIRPAYFGTVAPVGVTLPATVRLDAADSRSPPLG